jgi:hypothetical protein
LLVILLPSTTVFLGFDNLFPATISTFTTEERFGSSSAAMLKKMLSVIVNVYHVVARNKVAIFFGIFGIRNILGNEPSFRG